MVNKTKKRQSGGRSSGAQPKPPPRKRTKKNPFARGVKKLRNFLTRKKPRSGPPKRKAPKLNLTSSKSNMNVGTKSANYLTPVAGRYHNYPIYDTLSPHHEYAMIIPNSTTSSKGNQYVTSPNYEKVQPLYEVPPNQRNSGNAEEVQFKKPSIAIANKVKKLPPGASEPTVASTNLSEPTYQAANEVNSGSQNKNANKAPYVSARSVRKGKNPPPLPSNQPQTNAGTFVVKSQKNPNNLLFQMPKESNKSPTPAKGNSLRALRKRRLVTQSRWQHGNKVNPSSDA